MCGDIVWYFDHYNFKEQSIQKDFVVGQFRKLLRRWTSREKEIDSHIAANNLGKKISLFDKHCPWIKDGVQYRTRQNRPVTPNKASRHTYMPKK